MPIDPSRLRFKMPKVQNEQTEFLDPDQIRALIEAIEDEPNIHFASAVKLALVTGMRRGELARLEWRDVNFNSGFITLRGTKGGKDETIPMNAEAKAILESIPRIRGNPYVLGGHHKDTFTKAARAIRDRAKLPKEFRPLHGQRHTFASMLANSGKVDIYTLQKLLTHKSAAMTQRYAHLADEAMQRAANVAGDLFKDAADQNKGKVVNLDVHRKDD